MKTQQQQTATQDGVGKNANTVLSKLIGTSLTKHIKSFIDNSTVYCTTFNGVYHQQLSENNHTDTKSVTLLFFPYLISGCQNWFLQKTQFHHNILWLPITCFIARSADALWNRKLIENWKKMVALLLNTQKTLVSYLWCRDTVSTADGEKLREGILNFIFALYLHSLRSDWTQSVDTPWLWCFLNYAWLEITELLWQ